MDELQNLNENSTNVEMENNETNYIEAITNLKANSVSKDEYNKLREQNKQLLDTLVNGGQITTEIVQPKADINELRKTFFRDDLTNLEVWENALALRSACMEQEGYDPFVTSGHQYSPDVNDREQAQLVADVIQECIDQAQGNSGAFTVALMNHTVDNPALIMAKSKRNK